MKLKTLLKDERDIKQQGGLYHETQINFAYNSSKIEGSKLTERQTRSIFETRTVGLNNGEPVSVDNIIETSNHFAAFDYLLNEDDTPLSNDFIKKLHRLLKSSTSDATKEWFNIGDWKKFPNQVGGGEAAIPQEVENKMNSLNDWYNDISEISFENIVEYHYWFEKIHPFQEGNGRIGRLIMFGECLKHNIIPFIIKDSDKQFYYRGLNEFTLIRGYLLDTCLWAQDAYKDRVIYFYNNTFETKNKITRNNVPYVFN